VTTLIPNIELVIPEAAVNSLAASFLRRGDSPIAASLYVSSRPFIFDGAISGNNFTVRNIASGEVTMNYTRIAIDIQIEGGEIMYLMDNGDILNISLAMRSVGKGVFERMISLISLVGHPN
jgi:hypothetical protein